MAKQYLDLDGLKTYNEKIKTNYVSKSGDTMAGTLGVPSIEGVNSITLDEAGKIGTTGTHIDITAEYPRCTNLHTTSGDTDWDFMLLSSNDNAMLKGNDLTYNSGTKTLNVPTINAADTSTKVAINVGTNTESYFQSRKFRGQGDASTYTHAIDFGYVGHDQVDFYEYGGVYNFWQNQTATATTSTANKVASLQLGKLVERGNTLTYPGKSGTIALTDDITSEATTRANADTALESKITSEATTRANADTALETKINNLAIGTFSVEVWE